MEQEQAVQQEQVVEQQEPMDSKEPVKSYSQDEVDALLQREVDRRIGKARTKWEKEFTEKLEAEKAEAEKLSKLSADERAEFERKQMEEKFNAERAEFESQKKAFEMQKLELELAKELESKKIPVGFSSFLLGADAESTYSNLTAFSEYYFKSIQEAVEQSVQDALRGKEPQKNVDAKVMTKKQFLNLPYKERSKMLKENPELVQSILHGN